MIRCMLVSDKDGCVEGGEELLREWRESPDSRLWLDIQGEPGDDTRQLLQTMGCDELAINDSFRLRHPPKVERFDDTTFILFRGITRMDDSLELEPQPLSIWVGERHLITSHRGTSVSIEKFWATDADESPIANPGILALHIVHYACGRYLEKLLDFEDSLAELEEGLLTERSEEGMRELVSYRSRLRRLRRTFSYHKVLAEQIWQHGNGFPGLDDGDAEHVRRDVYDRCERLYSLCSMYYEICGDLVEGHISLSSHALNQTMKVLTIISALFVPLTFLAGIYGMNFEHMPELGWKYAYFTLLGVMAVLTVVMLIVFRRIRWL